MSIVREAIILGLIIALIVSVPSAYVLGTRDSIGYSRGYVQGCDDTVSNYEKLGLQFHVGDCVCASEDYKQFFYEDFEGVVVKVSPFDNGRSWLLLVAPTDDGEAFWINQGWCREC